MEYQYKIIISNKRIYKEFEIKSDVQEIKLGTTSSCELRLNSDWFFYEIELLFIKTKNGWNVLCNDSVYFAQGIRKMKVCELKHGDSFVLRYEDSSSETFQCQLMIDFESNPPYYNFFIELSQNNLLTLGTMSKNDIVLNNHFNGDNSLSFCEDNGCRVTVYSSRFGIYKNGKKITGKTVLRDYDFLFVDDASFYYKHSRLFFDRNAIKDTKVPVYQLQPESDFEYPKFSRSTRRKLVVNTEPINILDPGTKPTKPEINLVTTILPPLLMLAMIIVLRIVRSDSGSGTFIIFSLFSMGMSVMTSIANIVQGRKKYKKEVQERIDIYNSYIAQRKDQIVQARKKELDELKKIYIDPSTSLDNVLMYNANIFDRTPEDEDYLEIYLGLGTKSSLRPIVYRKQEKLEPLDELEQQPAKLAEAYKNIDNAPITVNLRENNAVGVVGTSEMVYVFFKNVVTDIICRHFIDEMSFVLLVDNNIEDYQWIKLLPQLLSNDHFRNIVFDKESRAAVFEDLYKECIMRSENKGSYKRIIVFSFNSEELVKHPISRFIQNSEELNVSFFFFEKSLSFLPMHCRQIIELKESYDGIIYSPQNQSERQFFRFDVISDEQMNRLIRKIAPIEKEEVNLESTLRKTVSLFELLGIYQADDLNLEERWNRSKVYQSMAAPLGINVKDEIVYLDLHEKAHGPHGLVAGTTGSGKSEILQSFILSLSTLFRPTEVGFLIIDFKGGGMVNQFENLPHLVGAITNIDGKQINRSLKSIKAELLKRQELFSQAGINQIDKYIQLYKEGKTEIPLPHLIIIVDEFAELKAEQPDFMAELVSTARIGRSLGVHLILATQKPAGQVNDQIWSNSRFKLCLKVQDRQDSQEVLKSPLASEIKEPGRAYLQVGNNEIFELFQSGFSGAPAEKDVNMSQKKFVLYKMGMTGREKILFQTQARKNNNSRITELESLVDYICSYCKEHKERTLSQICLPPLKEIIQYPSGIETRDWKTLKIPIGLFDDPDHQIQDTAMIDLSTDNALIIGSTQTGKTNLVQSMIRSLSYDMAPSKVSMYIIDFASMTLKIFESMNHVGGVIIPGEDEKLKNLFKMLSRQIQLRKEDMLTKGVGSFNSYLESGEIEYPRIVVFMENFSVFKELYEDQFESEFQSIVREGPTYGIHFVITNTRTAGLSYRYMSNFGTRIALYSNDSTEYMNLYERTRIEPDNIPGRAIYQLDNDIYEVQAFLAFDGETEVQRTANIREYVAKVNNHYSDEKAKRIPEVPEVLTLKYIQDNYKWQKLGYVYPIGLNYETVELTYLNCMKTTEFSIVSKRKEVRSSITNSLLHTIHQCCLFQSVRMFIIDNFSRELRKWKDYNYVERYTLDCSEIEIILDDCYQELENRQELMRNDQMEHFARLPLLMYVFNSEDAISEISENKDLLRMFNQLKKLGKRLKVIFIFTDVEDSGASYNSPELLKSIRDDRYAVTADKLDELKLFDIPINVQRRQRRFNPGDVYLIDGSEVNRVKLIDYE